MCVQATFSLNLFCFFLNLIWEIQRELNWCKPKHKTIQTDHNLFTQGSETDIPFESALCTYFYSYLHDYMYSNMSWHANLKKSFVMMILVAENKSKNIHVFTLWLFFFFTFFTLPFSLHVVACLQSNWQSGLGPCTVAPRLKGWHNNAGS